MQKTFEEVGVVFMANEKSTLISQPTDCPLDLPSVFVATKGSSVCLGGFLSSFSVGCDLLNSASLKRVTKPVGIGRLVIQKSFGTSSSNLDVNQRFNGVNLGDLRRDCECRDRQSVPLGQHHELGSFSLFSLTHFRPPFFAGENVPSPSACDQLSRFRRSSWLISRDHAFTSVPDSVHCLWRRQHVVKEGYRSGKSFHRAPVLRTHRMPSKHCRAHTRGRPPAADGSGSLNKSSINFHWTSDTNGCGAVLDPVVFGRRRCGHLDRVMSM